MTDAAGLQVWLREWVSVGPSKFVLFRILIRAHAARLRLAARTCLPPPPPTVCVCGWLQAGIAFVSGYALLGVKEEVTRTEDCAITHARVCLLRGYPFWRAFRGKPKGN